MKNDFRSHLQSACNAFKNDIVLTEDIKKMVMNSCDVRSILESWNVRPVLANGKQWNGYCPDHCLHDGHAQHLPKWSMNAVNGDCTCFTSAKSSNFIYVAKRMYKLPTLQETIEKLTNGEMLYLPKPDFVIDEAQAESDAELEEKRIVSLQKGIDMMKRLLINGGVNKQCEEYFSLDGITRKTLDFFGVCSVDCGHLGGRAMIPFQNDAHDICGYVAVNYVGKSQWVKREYSKLRKIDSDISEESIARRYRKTLYCPGFQSRGHLFGQYEVLNGGSNLDELVIVEGERDAMKLLQEGVDCVSIHGTILKPEQKLMLKAMNPKKLFVGMDMDCPGCIATVKMLDVLFGEFENVFVMNFPDGKDPKKFGGSEIRCLMDYAENHSLDNYEERLTIIQNRKSEGKQL